MAWEFLMKIISKKFILAEKNDKKINHKHIVIKSKIEEQERWLSS